MVKMISHSVYDFFIPNERNHMIPHGMGRTAFLSLVFIGFAILVSPIITSISHLATPTDIIGFTSDRVIELVNQARISAGLQPLSQNSLLAQAAARKAEDMFARQYFAHVTPDNKQPWEFLRAENYVYLAAGENLAIDFLNPESAHTALMNSPSHRENILNSLYSEVGVSVIPGTFQDHQSIIVVQFFGKPKSLPPPPAIVEIPPATGIVAAAVPEAPPTPLPEPILTKEQEPESPVLPAPAIPTESTEPTAPEVINGQNAVAGAEVVSVTPIPEIESEAVAPTLPLERIVTPAARVPYVAQVRLASLLAIFLMLLPALFFIVRTGETNSRLLLRPLIIVAFFTYIGWFGGTVNAALPALSPTGDATANCSVLGAAIQVPCSE
jgi:hypothetical protein